MVDGKQKAVALVTKEGDQMVSDLMAKRGADRQAFLGLRQLEKLES
jgi:hypothetical protein